MVFFRFLAWRVAGAVVLVFAVASGAMLLAQLAPGDYAAAIGRDPAVVAAERHRLGLDLPVGQQYARWLRRSLTLDLGLSLQTEQPVTSLVRERARNTAGLAVLALAVATAIGIPCGIFTGSRRTAAARLVGGGSLLLLSVPPLIMSLALLTLAAATGWLPVSGMSGPRSFVVPTLSLALPVAATLERLQSQSIGEALRRPSVLAARARGISTVRLVCGLRDHHRLALQRLVRRRDRDVVAGTRRADAAGAARPRHQPGRRLRRRGGGVSGSRRARRRGRARDRGSAPGARSLRRCLAADGRCWRASCC